jgi:ubiquitin carboxyl-terminal hydrolase 12/46
LNYLLNELVDILEKEAKANATGDAVAPGNTAQEKAINGTVYGLGSVDQHHPVRSWVHKLFQVYMDCIYTILMAHPHP